MYIQATEIISGAKNREAMEVDVNETLRMLAEKAITLDIELIKGFEDQETLKIVGKLTELERQKTGLEGQLSRFEAALKISQIEERIMASEAHMRHLKAVVKRKTSQLKALSQMIADLESQREKLVRIRGSEETLIESLPAERPNRKEAS